MTPLIRTLLLLLVTTTSINCMPSFVENDSIVFPVENTTSPTNLSKEFIDCLNDNFKILFNGECRALLSTLDVCQEGQWLVLDLESARLPNPQYFGRCKPKRCRDKEHYWVSLGRCVNWNESSALCPEGNQLSTDMFGDGYCKCNESSVLTKVRGGVCYPVFKPGPCSEGKVLVEVNEEPECLRDNCGSMRRQFSKKTIVPWHDNKCYPVGERGPCNPGLVVGINPRHKKPECRDPVTTLNLISAPCLGTDHSGNCVGPVRTPAQQFSNQVANQLNSKRHRKSSSDPK